MARIVSVGVLFLSLCLAGIALVASSDPTIDWWVIGAGGAHGAADGTSLGVTIGQWVAGRDAVDTTQLDSGFWSGVVWGHSVFMPLVLPFQN